MLISGMIFLVVYLMIVFEKLIRVSRTTSALIGAVAMIIFGILDQSMSTGGDKFIKGE